MRHHERNSISSRLRRALAWATVALVAAPSAARAEDPGLREQIAGRGLTFGGEATYTFQGVAAGGLDGSAFRAFSDEEDTGNVASALLALAIDTGKLGLWDGGTLDASVEGRIGRSVLQRAGSVSAVSNDALFPDVVDRFDEPALAVTEVAYTQALGERIALYGGLLNNAEGDENELAGSALSNGHFLNSALLYSLVQDATVPHVSLGGGITLDPADGVSGSISVFGTTETAGEDPFDGYHGTTFSTEWTVEHEIADRDGAQTFGALFGTGTRRADLAANPRTVLQAILAGQPIPATDRDTWALYYNGHQMLLGDEKQGLGVFARLGLSDGNPNPVRFNAAGGIGGAGWIPGREGDRFGAGAFYLDLSGEDLLRGLNVGDEVGGEVFLHVAVASFLHVTADAQVIDPALPRAHTACVLGVRAHLSF